VPDNLFMCYTESVSGTSCERMPSLSDLAQLTSDVIASRGPSADARIAYVIRTWAQCTM